MHKWGTLLVVVVLIFSTGCGGSVSTKAVDPDSGNELTLEVKPESLVLTQGDSAKLTITIGKTKFDEDVEVSIDNLPEGVALEGTVTTIAQGKDQLELVLAAGTNAKVVDKHEAKVSASGGGVTASLAFPITVDRKPGGGGKKDADKDKKDKKDN